MIGTPGVGPTTYLGPSPCRDDGSRATVASRTAHNGVWPPPRVTAAAIRPALATGNAHRRPKGRKALRRAELAARGSARRPDRKPLNGVRQRGRHTHSSWTNADQSAAVPACSHGDHDFAPGVAALPGSDSLRDRAQGIRPIDDRPDLPGLDKLFEGLQILLAYACHQQAEFPAHER